MSDAQQFLVTKPAGKALIGPGDILSAINSIDLALDTYEFVVTEVPEVTTILPWRVLHQGSTVAATDHPDKAVQVLLALADDFADGWSIEYHVTAV